MYEDLTEIKIKSFLDVLCMDQPGCTPIGSFVNVSLWFADYYNLVRVSMRTMIISLQIYHK